jgi:hypothetical protein
MPRRALLALLAVVVGLLASPWHAAAQALPNVNLTRVLYNTRKATVKPEGELKAQIDAVDAAIAEATKLGQTGEVRRQIAKGIVLLDGRAWTPALDFQTSLVLRAERTVVDSAAPYAVRLEQIYRPAIDLTPALSVAVRLKKRQPGGLPAAPSWSVVRELGVFDGPSRDLRESPFAMDLALDGVADDAYALEAEVRDRATSIGATMLPVVLVRGLDARLGALAKAAATVPAAVREDVAYPADYIRSVNRGKVGLGTFNVATELTAAEAIVTAAKGGKDPFAGRTGDFERHYRLEGANEVMPYRVYVPTGYQASKPMPLVVALHGLGATEDSFFDSYAKLTPKLAEQHGFLLAAPLGYRIDGFYGSPLMGVGDAAAKRRTEYSEQDVLQVLARMKAQYKVDGAGAVLGCGLAAGGRAYEDDSAVRRARRRRSHRERERLAHDGGGAQGGRRHRDLHRSAGRQPHRRGGAEPAQGVRVPGGAEEAGRRKYPAAIARGTCRPSSTMTGCATSGFLP